MMSSPFYKVRLGRALLLLLGWWLIACQSVGPTPMPGGLETLSVPSPTPTPHPATPAGFDAFLRQVEAARLADRRFWVSDYLAQLPSAPLVDEHRAIFLWRGDARRVQLVGDMNNWDPTTAPTFTRIEETELWWYEAAFESEARLDYKMLVDGVWRLDPLNSRTILGGFGPNSELAMPGYRPPPEQHPPTQPVPAGALTEHVLNSIHLQQRRTLFVHTPAGQLVGAGDAQPSYPSLYVHDGSDYLNLIDAAAILDRLIADRRIPPLVTVFIPPLNRTTEYNRDPAYTRFIVEEVVPFIQATYNTDPNPARTGTLGASLGGLIALHLGVTHPETFGLVAGQSGAYSLNDDGIIRGLAVQEPLPLRLHLVVGTYETAVAGNPVEGDLLGANRRLVGTLRDQGYDLRYIEAPAGHSWGLWRDYLGDALIFLYP